jgi:hypothetical protein
VIGGTGTTVTGTGSVSDPYVINAGGSALQVLDTNTVDMSLTGAGTGGNPYVISSNVRVSPTAGNVLTTDAGGLLITCEAIQDCVGNAFDDGLEYDDIANQFRARLSTDGGNSMSFGTDGGLYSVGGGGGGGLTFVSTADTNCLDISGNGTPGTPLSAAPIINAAAGNLLTCTATGLRAALTVAACGLTGTGAPASPLAVNTGAWPYPCSVDTFGGVVACDSTGRLRSEPRGYMFQNQTTANTSYANITVPAALDTFVESRFHLVANPDTCRESFTLVELELDVDFDLVAGAGGAAGMYTDEMYYHRNTGATTEQDFHIQTTKVIAMTPFNLAVGANNNFQFDVRMGRGSGGATYNRIQTFIRAFQWIL